MAPAPDSRPIWGVYLLSWDGARWKASRLVTGVEDFIPLLINLGPPVGRGLAVVIQEGDSQIAYPVIFQVKDHAATLLWDAQADDSRYEPLLQGRVSFQDHADAPAEMIVTGRADPGLLPGRAAGAVAASRRARFIIGTGRPSFRRRPSTSLTRITRSIALFRRFICTITARPMRWWFRQNS